MKNNKRGMTRENYVSYNILIYDMMYLLEGYEVKLERKKKKKRVRKQNKKKVKHKSKKKSAASDFIVCRGRLSSAASDFRVCRGRLSSAASEACFLRFPSSFFSWFS